jgi:histidyl-tRNA synthetase
MKMQAPPGMRDFYPEEMRFQNWLFDAWRRVSRAFAFEEIDGPIFEHLDLYKKKSGEGIVSELFSFQDRGGRELAIRPEMTPTVARMLAARASSLPRPVKWFTIARMCRAEKPQRGRLREFFQWNCETFGEAGPLADAEQIAMLAALLREIGLGPDDVNIRISHRALAASLLQAEGVRPERTALAFQKLDRLEKWDSDADFARDWNAQLGADARAERVLALLRETSEEACLTRCESAGEEGARVAADLRRLREHLDALGAADYCRFDLRIVRGLAYYTGTVFEAHGRAGELRAVAGGGRYDELVELLGGPATPAIGFAMGDCVIAELLRELDRAPRLAESLDVYVIDADEALFPDALRLVADLRRQRLAVGFSYKRAAVSKQFKLAAARGARFAVVVGQELRAAGQAQVKDLTTGEQRSVRVADLRTDARAFAPRPDPKAGP